MGNYKAKNGQPQRKKRCGGMNVVETIRFLRQMEQLKKTDLAAANKIARKIGGDEELAMKLADFCCDKLTYLSKDVNKKDLDVNDDKTRKMMLFLEGAIMSYHYLTEFSFMPKYSDQAIFEKLGRYLSTGTIE